MKTKKAQMKIQQMAFMLIAVTLFFVLVGLFGLSIMFSGLKDSAALLEEENAMLLVTKLANAPEFSCGEAFGSSKVTCIDGDKVLALKENIEAYSNFWGVSGIEIKKISPAGDVIQIFGSSTGVGVSTFVALCRKASTENNEIYDKCELAKIIVRYGE